VKVEFDADRQMLEIDTPFFDGIPDYDTNIELKDIDISSEEKAKESLKTIMKDLVKEYQNKLNEVTESKKIIIKEYNIEDFDLNKAKDKITKKGTFNNLDIGTYKN
jgi:hypothetical protein